MIEEVFSIGSFSISPFGLALVAAFFAAFWQLRRNMMRLGIGDDEDASALLFWAAAGGIVGGKLYYALLYDDLGLFLSRSGIVWYGGFLLGAAAVLLSIRRRRLPFARTADAAAPALALGYGIGRIGCFLVGDDYGVPTDRPWGVVFPHGLPETTAGNLRQQFGVDIPASVADSTLVAVHPTQLYETAMAVVIWLVGMKLLRRGGRPGNVALAVVALLAVERILIEVLRAKDDRFFGVLTLAQAISLGLLALIALLVALRARRSATGAAARPAAERS